MNRLSLIIIALLLISCSNQNKEYTSLSGFKTEKTTQVKFESQSFAFKQINKGDTAQHTYKFKNIGKNDLVITRINVSCGCLIPDYPKRPVKPGMTDSIIIKYSSKTKSGRQLGRLVFHMNTEPKEEHELILEGVVRDVIAKK